MDDKATPRAEEAHNSKGENEQPSVAIQEPTQPKEAAAPSREHKDSEPEVKAKTGRAKRREKRLRHEPQNVTVKEGPSGIHVLDFAEARATELSCMVKALRSKGGSKRTFQLLPRHMRRRAMSHNVKRLPRRLRSQAEREMDKGKAGVGDAKKKAKKLSRKQRRKPSNMKQEYQRRQRRYKWLETHIWHANRMKMTEKYGYRIAEHCSDKGIRQAYLSMTHGCLLSDISYYCCTEICGDQNDIISSLSSLFSPETGLTIKAKAYLSGQREGKAVMYQPGAYPHGAIGPVQFLWQAPPPTTHQMDGTMSNTSTQQSKAKLWVWCHPAIHDTVLKEMEKAVNSFNSKSSKAQAEESSRETTTTTKTGAVTVESLKSNLVRFRLIGPRSQALLMETLKPVLTFEEEKDASSSELATPVAPPIPSPPVWWTGDLQQRMMAHSNLLSQALHSIKSGSSPAHVCRGSVVGMTVVDPRLFTPSKRTDRVSAYYPKKKNGYLLQRVVHKKRSRERERSDLDSDSDSCRESESGVDGDTSEMEEGQFENDDQISVVLEPVSDGQPSLSSSQHQVHAYASSFRLSSEDLPQDIAFSPIWDANICDVVSKSKIPDHILNLQRSKQLVHPTLQDLQSKASRIPILLVQQSYGSDCASGWDLILPANWGMAFWVSLIYRGARACGMRELQKCSLEAQALHFPSDYPDTSAGQQYSNEQRQFLEAKYLRYPPDKRRNYGKLLIRQPFSCPWGEVVTAWSQEASISHILPPEPQVVSSDHDQVTEIHTPSKRRKLTSGRESPELFDSRQGAETKESLEGGPRSRKRSLSSLTTNSDVPRVQIVSTFYVLRSRDPLNCLNHFIEYLFSKKKTSEQVRGFTFSLESGLSMEASRFFSVSMQQFQIDEHLRSHSSALLAVRFETTQRGTITDRATISLPSAKDLQLFSGSVERSERARSGPKEELNQRGLTVVDGETIFIGVSSLCRKEIKEVKRKRLGRAKCTSDKQKNGNGALNGRGQSSSSTLPTAWDEFKLQPVRPSRREIGYATSAGYRLTTSHFSGVGFCTFAGLVETVKQCFFAPGVNELVALVRGESIQYWFIKLHIQ